MTARSITDILSLYDDSIANKPVCENSAVIEESKELHVTKMEQVASMQSNAVTNITTSSITTNFDTTFLIEDQSEFLEILNVKQFNKRATEDSPTRFAIGEWGHSVRCEELENTIKHKKEAKLRLQLAIESLSNEIKEFEQELERLQQSTKPNRRHQQQQRRKSTLYKNVPLSSSSSPPPVDDFFASTVVDSFVPPSLSSSSSIVTAVTPLVTRSSSSNMAPNEKSQTNNQQENQDNKRSTKRKAKPAKIFTPESSPQSRKLHIGSSKTPIIKRGVVAATRSTVATKRSNNGSKTCPCKKITSTSEEWNYCETCEMFVNATCTVDCVCRKAESSIAETDDSTDVDNWLMCDRCNNDSHVSCYPNVDASNALLEFVCWRCAK